MRPARSARVGEQGEVVGIVHVGAGLAGELETSLELGDPLLVRSLGGQRPPVQDRRHGEAVPVAVPGGRLHRRLRVRAGRRDVEAALLDDRGLRERGRVAVPAARIVGERHRLSCAFAGEVGVSEEPEREGRPAVARGAGVVAVGRRDRIEVLPVVGGEALLGVLERVVEDALVEQAAGQQLVRVRQQPVARRRAGERERLLRAARPSARSRRGPRRACRAGRAPSRARRRGRAALPARVPGGTRSRLPPPTSPACAICAAPSIDCSASSSGQRSGPSGEALEHVQARGQVLERLAMGEPLERLLGCETQRHDGASGVARPHEVLGDLCRDLLRVRPVGGLEPHADPRVRLRALSGGKPS